MSEHPTGDDLRRALSGGVLALDVEDIQRLLPHRPPMLLVDRVLSMVPGQHGVGLKAVSGNECGLRRRRHGFVFPATFAAEALAQLAAIVLLYRAADGDPDPEQEPASPGLLVTIRSLEIHREMVEAERLQLSVSVLKQFDGFARIQGEASIDQGPFISTTFDLALNLDG